MRVLASAGQAACLRLVSSHLVRHGFVVDAAETAGEALGMIAATAYDVVLFDLARPSGDERNRFVERLRRDGSTVPVIVLAAGATAAERIDLLDAGADDYMVKPIDLDELVARIRAVSRRGRRETEQPLRFADLSFYPRRRAALINGRPLVLRPREAALLEVLLARAGEAIHRDQLKSSVYAADEEIGSNSLDVHVHHLRQRLAQAEGKVRIATVRGLGYALRGREA